jgi:dipeptidyl aminopeptidase/acylaminoacyl peptidase
VTRSDGPSAAPGRLTAEDLWALPRVGRPVSDRSGRVVVVPVTDTTRDDPVTRLHRIASNGPSPLTTADASATSPALSPTGSVLAFLRDHEDRPQLHVLPLDGGEARRVTDLPLGVAGRPVWLPDERGVVVLARLSTDDPSLAGTLAHREREEARPDTAHVTERRLYRFWDTWLADATTTHLVHVDVGHADEEPVDLTGDVGFAMLPGLGDAGDEVAVSPDGRTVAWCAVRDDDDLPRYLLHVAPTDGSGPSRCLTPDAPAHVWRPRFLPDGRILAGFQRELAYYASPCDLYAVDPGSGARDPLLVDCDLQPEAWEVTAAGRIVFATERSGRGVLCTVQGGAAHRYADPDPVADLRGGASPGSLTSPVPAGDDVLAVHSGLTAPPEVVRLGATTTLVTEVCAGALGGHDLGAVTDLVVTGASGDDIGVRLLHAPGGVAEEPPSLVHLIHGGPHGVFADAWSWRWNAAVVAARGHLVATVDFHGSTSYGHAFTRSIHGDWPTLPAADIHAVTDALIARDAVDRDRLAITGGSYGGYLVTWLAAHSDRFACAVAHAAVTDFGGMWAGDWTYGWADALGGAPWEDHAASLRGSPAAHYADYATPTLVVHGDRDHRVPVDQGLALYGVLRAKGVTARLLHFPDEGHWVERRANSLVWYREVLDWLDRHLR